MPFASLVISVLCAGTPTYEITELGSLFGGSSHVFDMNEVGEVVGLSRNGGLHSEPYVWSGGTMFALPTFGGTISESGATDLLDDGTIVGYSATPQLHDPPFETCEIIRAFRIVDGTLENLGSLSAGGDSIATGLNAAGRIIGWSHTNVQSLTYRGFLWEAGVMTDLGTLGGPTSAAWDIDDAGRIVGESTLPNGDIHAFAWIDGAMMDIDTFASRQSVGRATSEVGQTTGMWRMSFGESPKSFIHDDVNGMQDIGSLGGGYAEAFAINDQGVIVGTTTTEEGDLTGFVWQNGVMTDLRDLAPGLPDGFVGYAIDESGRIAGTAWVGSTKRAYLLEPLLTGDVNDDGVVNFADVLAVIGAWGPCPAHCPADMDGDGTVGFSDVLQVIANWT